jgi:PAS domain S-box-containing protein
VVVAEDNVDHQRVIAEVVRRLGHEAVVAADGRAGLAAVTRHRPDLLVADVDMPHLDGLELCREIRADPRIAATPVVLITAFYLADDPRLAESGAVAVIGKPFRVPDLTAAIREHLDPPAATGGPALLDALIETLDVGVVACDGTGRLVFTNRAMRELFGCEETLSDWQTRTTLRHHDGTPLRTEELPLLRALAGEEVRHADLLAEDRHGRPRWFAVNARPVRDATGATVGAVAAMHDMTAQYRARQYQDCKAEVLKTIADSADAKGVADRILTAVGTTLGWPYLRLWLVDEVTDLLRPAGIYTEPGRRALPTPAGLARGKGLAGVAWERGELLWVPDIHAPDSPVLAQVAEESTFRAAGAVPVRCGDQVTGVLSFFSDIRQELEPALGVLLTGIAGVIGAFLEQRRAEVLALHLAAATDEYIALVGHELRTPLTSVGAYVDLIAESPDDTPIGEVREMLEVVQRNNARLRDLVEKLLDLAALESGHLPLATQDVDLPAVVAAAVDAIAPAARERQITVRTTLPDHRIVPGDPARLRQMVDDLLSNAVKFSPPESAVTVTLADDGEAAVLTVADTGAGMPATEHARVFRRLYRGGNARHTGIPGAGLGLARCRVVVERHGGTITLASREAVGTTVTVRLPGRG